MTMIYCYSVEWLLKGGTNHRTPLLSFATFALMLQSAEAAVEDVADTYLTAIVMQEATSAARALLSGYPIIALSLAAGIGKIVAVADICTQWGYDVEDRESLLVMCARRPMLSAIMHHAYIWMRRLLYVVPSL